MIRAYKHPDDFEEVKNYCYKHKVAFPDRNLILLVSFNDQGKVNGLAGLKQELHFEPLISENPMVANNLGRMVEGIILDRGFSIITATVPRENIKHIEQLESEGFVIRDNNLIILEKKYG